MDHQSFATLLGNYGEFVGAIGVVMTLGYLAFQIVPVVESLVNRRSNCLMPSSQRDLEAPAASLR